MSEPDQGAAAAAAAVARPAPASLFFAGIAAADADLWGFCGDARGPGEVMNEPVIDQGCGAAHPWAELSFKCSKGTPAADLMTLPVELLLLPEELARVAPGVASSSWPRRATARPARQAAGPSLPADYVLEMASGSDYTMRHRSPRSAVP